MSLAKKVRSIPFWGQCTVVVFLFLGAWGFVILQEKQRGSLLPDRPDTSGFPSGFNAELLELEERVTTFFPPKDAWVELGSLYLANGFLSEAKHAFEMYLEIEADSPETAEYYLGHIAQQEGDLTEAIARFERVVENAPDYKPAHTRLAESLSKQGRDQEAETIYRSILKVDDRSAIATVGLARILGMKNYFEEALRLVLNAYEESSDSVRLAREAIRLLERAGQSDRSAEIRTIVKNKHDPPVDDPWIDKLVDVCFDSQRLSVLFEDWFKAGRLDEAFSYLERLELIGETPDKAAFLRGFAFFELGKFEDASRSLQKSLNLGTEPTQVFPLLATCFIELEKFQEAQSVAEKGVVLDPRSTSLNLSLGIAEFELGMKASSINRFNIVLNFDSKNVKAMRYLSRIYGEIGDLQNALKYLERIREESKDDFISRARLGQHHLENSDPVSAVSVLKEAFALEPENPKVGEMLSYAYMQLGSVAASNGRYDEAIENYESAIEVSANNVEAYVNIAKLYAALKKYDLAERSLKRLLIVDPVNPTSYLIYGDVLKIQMKTEEALLAWRKAQEIATASGSKEIEQEATTRIQSEVDKP